MKIAKKILLSLLVLAAIAVTILFFGTRYEVKLHSGALTGIVDPDGFFHDYGSVEIGNVNVLIFGDSIHFAKRNVLLEDGVIKSVDTVSMGQKDTDYIDGSGKYLIPGLIDTHVHLENSKNDLYLYLAKGVTGVYEMYGTRTHLKWRDQADQGALSPRIRVASKKIISAGGIGPKIDEFFGSAISMPTEAAVIDRVQELKSQGFDALKLSSRLNKDIYRAINEEAQAQNISVVGHVSLEVGLENLFRYNQSHVAHVEEILKNLMDDFGEINEKSAGIFLRQLEVRADTVAKRLRNRDISVSTTIWLMESLPEQVLNLPDFIRTIELAYVNPGILEGSNINKGWLPGNNSYELPGLSEEDRKWEALFWETYVKGIHIITKSLFENEVDVLIGTDANVPGTVPGFSMHDEMRAVSELGVPNGEILRSATLQAAEFMGAKSGAVLAGHNADLLLLSGNPIEDIDQTRNIERVFIGTKRLDKEDIAGLLSEILKMNDDARSIDISENSE